jgi:uncharacterized repeat protein (TIGR03803 family)
MSKLGWSTRACGTFLLWAVAGAALPAQTFTTLQSFDGTDGANPYVGLVQATDGNLYGTTYFGGANNDGTVFKITLGGTVTTLHSFAKADGVHPYARLVQATDGSLYGSTYSGGANNDGTLFKITTSGTLTSLLSFDGADGDGPGRGLMQGADGDLYGTTAQGGANSYASCDETCGTVFKVTTGGMLTTIYSFCSLSDCADGFFPYAWLIQAANGDFYGTTAQGGAHSCLAGECGTVFKITPNGTLTTLHSFDGADGQWIYASLVQATDGSFYGTAFLGGTTNNLCTYGCGTVFKVTSGGTFTTLHSFDMTDGGYPQPGLVQGTDGNLYGTTYFGGANGAGTVFKITPSGTLTTLHSFDFTGGGNPIAGLVQDTNGTFYGTTEFGGTNGDGTVFSLSVGLGPFVETQTASGNVGAAVTILGADLTGATSVTFNGTKATFTVVSESAIAATVPIGATTGTVGVATPGGTLKSNVPFTVN